MISYPLIESPEVDERLSEAENGEDWDERGERESYGLGGAARRGEIGELGRGRSRGDKIGRRTRGDKIGRWTRCAVEGGGGA